METADAAWATVSLLPEGSAPGDEGPSLEPVKRHDFANIRVELAPIIRPGISIAANAANIRVSMLAADTLQSALERPNREVTTTARPTIATTMQALELTNGATLDDALKQVADKHLPEATKAPEAWAAEFFRATLGRLPSPAERGISAEILGKKPTAPQVADLAWMLVNHPEFQLIR